MQPTNLHYFPLWWPFLLGLFLLFAFVIALIELRILRYAYERMGISPRYVMAILLLSLFGSAINIPVAELPDEKVAPDQVVDFFGVSYVVPGAVHASRTIIAVNVGGALIPTILSLYLLVKNGLYLRGLLGIGVVAFVVHQLAHPVHGVGIGVPVFLPPLVAAVVAMILSWHRAPALAYIAGTMGTLIGADLLNLNKIPGLGAPVASIGGAGTFDGVFLTGIIAVLLAPAGRPGTPKET